MNLNKINSNTKNQFYEKNHNFKQGQHLSVVAASYYILTKYLNHQLKSLASNKKLNLVKISVNNAITQHNGFVDKFISLIEEDNKIKFSENQTEEFKIFKEFHTKDELYVSLKEFKHQCKNSLEKISEILAKNIGISILSHSFQINNFDIQNKDLSSKEIKKKSIELDCLQYALYMLGEQIVYDWINEKTDLIPFVNHELINFLSKKLNYLFVNDPQKNDLIIYLNELKHPIHVGIFSDPQTVQSKWGQFPQIFLHPIHVHPYESSSFIILRKPK